MGPSRPSPGLLLLFSKGKRPGREALLAALAALPHMMVSHDPGQRAAGRANGRRSSNPAPDDSGDTDAWLELMIDGMTFDLLGLAPGPGLAVPEIVHRFNCAADIGADTVDAVGLLPGPHIAEGAHTLPVVRALMGLGASLAEELPRVKALLWTPARAAIARPFFSRVVGSWLAGGPFPALGLVAFDARDDGTMRTEGLDFFIGQELELTPVLAVDRVAATRLAARLVHELVALGWLSHPLEIVTEGGVPLLLDPGDGGEIIGVSPM